VTQPIAILVNILDGKAIFKCLTRKQFLGSVYSTAKEKLPLKEMTLKNGNELK